MIKKALFLLLLSNKIASAALATYDTRVYKSLSGAIVYTMYNVRKTPFCTYQKSSDSLCLFESKKHSEPFLLVNEQSDYLVFNFNKSYTQEVKKPEQTSAVFDKTTINRTLCNQLIITIPCRKEVIPGHIPILVSQDE